MEQLRVYFTQTGHGAASWEGEDYVCEISSLARVQAKDIIVVVDSPKAADIIILLETGSFQSREYGFALSSHPLVEEHLEKIYVWNPQYRPIPFLNGLYVSLPKPWLRPQQHRACCYIRDYNRQFFYDESSAKEPRFLASFRGAASHDVRRRLFKALASAPESIELIRTDRWFDYDETEKKDYAENLTRAKFVICPRGIATSSYRLYEAMQVGRCPVIISDKWVPPSGPDWESCSIFVSEAQLSRLEQILAEAEPAWRQKGSLARHAWLVHFDPNIRIRRLLESTIALHLTHPPLPQPSEWRREGFYWQYQSTRLHGLFRRLVGILKAR